MGVSQLWSVVQPCGRPVKIDTLNKKRLAIDASIWIYQFLKAVRDKEGNALRNSHVVGFFRRICKLLFFGIKPIFVFDGGAPILKRQTISGRKQRREGRREDAVRTAGKLLALQMQRRAEDEDVKRREAQMRPPQRDDQEEEVPDHPVYVDELAMTEQERQQNRKFRKKDQYHLPDLDLSLAEMGQPNDPRVMSLEELEQYARQFDTGEDINVYDFSKIDFNGPFFQSLPATDRYNILNAARLRSRLRMGYSKDQLESMFPDRMAFSRFQIERVKERNELTQRLMHVTGMTDDALFGVDGAGRIAGEKGREYVLVKNAGVEGGWALGVIGEKDQGDRSKPIDVDKIGADVKEEEEEQDSDEGMGFEDVPIEGLNRLPKLKKQAHPVGKTSTAEILRRREAHYSSRRTVPKSAPKKSHRLPQVTSQEDDSLFVQDDRAGGKVDAIDPENEYEDDDGELERAIALSLKKDNEPASPQDDDFEDVFQERNPDAYEASTTTIDPPAIVDGKGGVEAVGTTIGGPFDQDEDEMDLGGALAHAGLAHKSSAAASISGKQLGSGSKGTLNELPKFDGPLPFEKLDLGSSLLGKKKMKKIEQDSAGGFEKEKEKVGDKKSAPLPPWFSGDVQQDSDAQRRLENEERAQERRARAEKEFTFDDRPKLRTQETNEVIDVDAVGHDHQNQVINVDSSEDEVQDARSSTPITFVEDNELRMGDMAELARGQPPIGDDPGHPDGRQPSQVPKDVEPKSMPPTTTTSQDPTLVAEEQQQEPEEDPFEWEESDHEKEAPQKQAEDLTKPAGGRLQTRPSKSPSVEFEFEDENMIKAHDRFNQGDADSPEKEDSEVDPATEAVTSTAAPLGSDDEEYFSGDEDEELMLQMATEAEEHARFASQLNSNNNSRVPRQNMEDYERELKSLRSQQKKDRRDADEVTHIMVQECQQLLKLFGLPYITAPMEAEAQCAELVHLGIVDGIVTDDSDVFLFGGTRVYKNMFNQDKFVECYLTSDLEREFDLTRDKMIRIAHLLGSDYTEGLAGIGPVTALEIIGDFPEGLQAFRDWWSRVQMGLPPTDDDTASPFRRKFRRNSTRLFLPPAFPDTRVDQAYLHPEVDSDPSAFQWGVPDLDALRSFLMATIGWTQERTDEVLVPVVRDMNRRENEGTQANITNFLGGAGRGGGAVGAGAFAPRRRDVGKSKRMERALEKLAERARERRKNGPTAGAETKNSGGTVAAGDAVVAVPGSAVADGQSGSVKKTHTVSMKRKVARMAVESGESDFENDLVTTAKPKKTKRKQGKKKTKAT